MIPVKKTGGKQPGISERKKSPGPACPCYGAAGESNGLWEWQAGSTEAPAARRTQAAESLNHPETQALMSGERGFLPFPLYRYPSLLLSSSPTLSPSPTHPHYLHLSPLLSLSLSHRSQGASQSEAQGSGSALPSRSREKSMGGIVRVKAHATRILPL